MLDVKVILKFGDSQLKVEKLVPNCFAKILDRDHEGPVGSYGSKNRQHYFWAAQMRGKPDCD